MRTSNGPPDSYSLFSSNKGKLHANLCYNAAVPWSVDFIAEFENLWHWDCLGANDRIYHDIAIQHAFRKYLKPVNIFG